MKKFFVILLAGLTLVAAVAPEASARKKKKEEPAPAKIVTNDKGYYKDVWMDSGIGVSSRRDLPSTRYLGLQMEALVTPPKDKLTAEDTLLQNATLIGSEIDENGVLFYPDGAPRFRCIYMNGGNAMALSRPLGDAGRKVFTDFIHAGGSYVGSCAGAFFACHYKLMDDGVKDYSPEYIGIWPGVVRNTLLTDTPTGIYVDEGSPLLKYYDFGGDNYVEEVYHNGGCYGICDTLWPAAGEVLARYDISMLDSTKRDFHGYPAIWSVKEHEEWGRVISCGSHPEGSNGGERLQLMSAMLRYALEGNAPARIKGELALGTPREMVKTTGEQDPDFTRIGDLQYHHFTVNVPAGLDTLNITVDTPDETFKDCGLWLFADQDDFAFRENARYQNITRKAKTILQIPAPKPGMYYVSVYCATTVDATDGEKGTVYSGHTEVLNGVPYIIEVH